MPDPLLHTDRLVLRRLDERDADFVVALLNDPAWIANIGERGVRTAEDAKAWIAGGPGAMFFAHGFGLMACDLRDGGETAGICGLIRRPGLDDVDLGYALLPPFRGRGLAVEAARATLAWAREVHGLRRVVAFVTPTNAPSIRVLERCGFVPEGRRVVKEGEGPLALYAVTLA